MRSACGRRRGRLDCDARAARRLCTDCRSPSNLPLRPRAIKCEIGSLLHKGDVPREDAVVVARLRAAGALILGTTNCPEFLMAYETANLLHGRTRNPWDLERTPGGSSGGESAAIAAGLSAAGLGSDSGGSVRVPAHFTGICSLKPTPGRVPGRGHLPPCVGPFSILGAIGPMARTMADVALLFRALSGQDPPTREPASSAARAAASTICERNTIGFFEDDGLVPVTPETRAAVKQRRRRLREAGFRVEPFRPRTLEQLRKLWWKFFVQCGAMFYEPADSRQARPAQPHLQRVSRHRRIRAAAHSARNCSTRGRSLICCARKRSKR